MLYISNRALIVIMRHVSSVCCRCISPFCIYRMVISVVAAAMSILCFQPVCAKDVPELPDDWQSYNAQQLVDLRQDLLDAHAEPEYMNALTNHVRNQFINDPTYLIRLSTEDLISFVGNWGYLIEKEKQADVARILSENLTDTTEFTNLHTDVFERFIKTARYIGVPSENCLNWVDAWIRQGESWKQTDTARVAKLLIDSGYRMPPEMPSDNESHKEVWTLLVNYTLKVLDEDQTAIDRILSSALFDDTWQHLTKEKREFIRSGYMNRHVTSAETVTGMSTMDFRQLLRDTERLEVGNELRSSCLDTWVRGNESWRKSDFTSISWLFRELSNINATDTVTQHEIADYWMSVIEDDPTRLNALIAYKNFNQLLQWLDAEQVKNLSDMFVALYAGGNSFNDVSLYDLQLLISLAPQMRIERNTVESWVDKWLSTSGYVESATPDEMVLILHAINRKDSHTEQVVDQILKRLENDQEWYVESPSISLLQTLEPILHDNQRALMGRLLSDDLLDSEAVWANMSYVHLKQLQQIGSRLHVEKDRLFVWMRDWIEYGDGWKRESPWQLALVLHSLANNKSKVDTVRARMRIIDYVIEQAQNKSAWIDRATDGNYAIFIVSIACELRDDARYGDTDRTIQALAAILNASSVTDNILQYDLEQHGHNIAYPLQQLWYGNYQLHACNGSEAWGEGESLQTGWIAKLIHSGLVSGKIKPNHATLYLLSWHFEGIEESGAWKQFLDHKILVSEPGSADSCAWLIARAYASEISSIKPNPIAGNKWINQALENATVDEDRVQLIYQISLRYAAAQDLDRAVAFLEAWSSNITDEESHGLIVHLHTILSDLNKPATDKCSTAH